MLVVQGVLSGVLDEAESSALLYLHCDFASQLESSGMVEWAIYVLLHLPANEENKSCRERAIKSLLSRHAEDWADTERENFLLNELLIPRKWLQEAKAELAGYSRQWEEMLECLLASDIWSRAHELLMVNVAPSAFVEGKHADLQRFIGLLKPHADELQNWVIGGRLLDDYYSIMESFSGAAELVAADLVTPTQV